VPKGKRQSGRLSVFKGREAKLNKTIFHILALKGPQPVSTLLREIRRQRGLSDTRDGVLRRRVQALQKLDYLMRVGTVKTHVGAYAPVYQLTPSAELALTLCQINLDRFIRDALMNPHRTVVDREQTEESQVNQLTIVLKQQIIKKLQGKPNEK
jgi:hypothetical protein